jgi:type I restriction enzyme S subunit
MATQDYQRVTFADAVTDCTGGNSKIQRRDYKQVGEIPIIDQGQEFIAGYINGMESAYRGVLPVVLFGDHTRCFKLIDFPFALGADGVKVLEPREGFDAKFLYFYFRSIELPNAGYSRHFKFLREVCVPKPSLAEQHRIVDILSRAEGIVRLRREAQKKAAEIIPALFFDMFGDPATNPKRWPVAKIGEVCSVQTGSTPSRKNPAYYDGNIHWVKTAEISGSTIIRTEEKISGLALMESNCKVFPVGTILVAMYGQGQTRGRSAMLGIEAATNQACAAILPSDKIIGEFLFCFLQTQYEELRGLAHGGNQPNLNLSMVKTYQVVLPPVGLQSVFKERFEEVVAIQSQQSAATQKAETTFDALLARAFNDNTI